MNRVVICIFFSLFNSTDLNAADHRPFNGKCNFTHQQAETVLAECSIHEPSKLRENAMPVQQMQWIDNQDRGSSPALGIESEGVVPCLERITGLSKVLIRYELSTALANPIGQGMKSQERRDIFGIKYAEIGFSTEWNNYIQNKTKTFWDVLINKCDYIKYPYQFDWFFDVLFKSILALDEKAFNARLTVLVEEDSIREIESFHLKKAFVLFFLESLITYGNGKVFNQEIEKEKLNNIIKASNQFFLHDMNEDSYAKVVIGFAKGGIASVGQIREFAGNIRPLFTDDMTRYDRASIIEGLSQGGIPSAEQIQEFAGSIEKHKAGLFLPDMNGGGRSWIITALLKGDIISAEQIKSVISLFSPDMNRYARAIIIEGLSQGGITSAEQIQEFAGNIEKHKAGLFAQDMDGWDYTWVISALAKGCIVSAEQMQGIVGQFNENMDGWERAEIIRRSTGM